MPVRSIQARIAACFSAILLLLCLSAGLTFVAANRISVNFSRSGAAQHASQALAVVAEQGTLLQLRVVEYVASEAGADQAAAAAALTALRTLLSGVAVQGSKPLATAQQAADDLVAIVGQISEAIIARHAAGARMADTGAALSGVLGGIGATATQQAVPDVVAGVGLTNSATQRASLFATRYLVSASPADLAAATADLGHAIEQLKTMGITADSIGNPRLQRQVKLAQEVSRNFGDAVDTVYAATSRRAAALSRLRSAIDALKAGMAEAKAGLDADASAADHSLVHAVSQAGPFVMALAIVSIGLSLLCIVVIRRTCVIPLNDLVRSVRALATGRLDLPIGHIKRSDEIGEVAGALDALRLSAITAKAAEGEASAFAAAAANERHRLVHESATATEQALGEVARSVGRTAERLLRSADELNEIASRTSARAGDVVTGSAEGQKRAETVATVANRLVSQIGSIEQRVLGAAAGTAGAARDAQQTELAVKSLAGAADGVDHASRLIAEVAKRTKLLALNADIEAARAGEAGRGFRVVANEVKALAAQTALATDQITREVRTMRAAVDGSVGRIRAIHDTINSVNQVTLDVADTFREQHLFVQGFLAEAEQSAAAAGLVANAMQAVMNDTSDAVRSADELRDVAAEVAAQGNRLDQELGKVVCELRAA